MRSPRLLLVGSDQQLLQDVCLSLNDAMAVRFSVSDFDSARQHLDSRTSSVLVCVAGRPEDIAPTGALVRELLLRQWPMSVVLITRDGVRRQPALQLLEQYVATRLSWPDDAATLADLPILRQHIRPDRSHSSVNGTCSSTGES